MSDPSESQGVAPRERLLHLDPHRLRTILWLRRRIARNQWARAGTLGRTLHVVFRALGIAVAAGGAALGIALGIGMEAPEPVEFLRIWHWIAGLFLFLWFGYVLVDVQRSETIDATKLLHLPVTHGQVFVLNYLASWITPMLIVTAPAMSGLAVGFAIGSGARYLWLLPLLFGFAFIVTSLTYWLRGWLAGLMANPRRRRSILVGTGMAVVLLSQLPNIWFNALRPGEREPRAVVEIEGEPVLLPPATSGARARLEERYRSPASRLAHAAVPFLWLPGGAAALAEGNRWPAALGSAGSLILGAWALRRAHRSALRAYLGAGAEAGAAPRVDAAAIAAETPAAHHGPARKSFVERSLPFVSAQTSAVAMATLRSYSRAPETRMGLAMPFVMLVCFGTMMLRPGVAMGAVEDLIPGGLATTLLFGWTQFAVNQFGFDRNGFRALLLAPVPRARILLGKNLALLVPSLLLQGIVSAILLALGRHDVPLLAAGVVQFLTGFLVLAIIGNWASVATPYRVAHGTMRRPKLSRQAVVVGLGIVISFPVAMLPALAPSILEAACRAFGRLPGVPVALLSSLAFLVVTAILYALLLDAQGRHLASHEQRVLEIVTHEIE